MIFFRRGSWENYVFAGGKAHDKGNYPDAEKHIAAAVKEAEGFGPQDPRLAASLLGLGELYLHRRRYATAESLLKRGLAIREKALGPEHPDVAGSLNNLAALYDDQGKYAEAEPLVKRALEIAEKALGPDHPHVATALENYAALLRKTERNDEATKLEDRAKAIRAKHAKENPAK